jgi:hypothetical protein
VDLARDDPVVPGTYELTRACSLVGGAAIRELLPILRRDDQDSRPAPIATPLASGAPAWSAPGRSVDHPVRAGRDCNPAGLTPEGTVLFRFGEDAVVVIGAG